MDSLTYFVQSLIPRETVTQSIVILFLSHTVSIAIHICSIVLILLFVIPLQVKQSHVKNGLLKLRKQLLYRESIAVTVIILTIIALIIRFSNADADVIRYSLAVSNIVLALGFFSKAFIDYRIYRQQYSPESKLLHRKLARLERLK